MPLLIGMKKLPCCGCIAAGDRVQADGPVVQVFGWLYGELVGNGAIPSDPKLFKAFWFRRRCHYCGTPTRQAHWSAYTYMG